MNEAKFKISDLKVSDKVYVQTRYRYIKGVVARITKTGMVDVEIGKRTLTDGTQVPIIERFNPDGEKRGQITRYDFTCIDQRMTFDERTADIAKDEQLKSAACLISKIAADTNVNFRYGKVGLSKCLDELQAKIDEARKLLETL